MLFKNAPILVNIIMPVFNAKMYISDAITSILEQSYQNIQLFIIDDGSSDGSGDICDKFAEEDSRVKVIHQNNHGLCHARNKGLEMIRGGYVAFADHDDMYLPGSIEHLVKYVLENDVDLVKGTYVGEIVNNHDSMRKYAASMPNTVFNLQELANHYTIFNYAVRAVWNGMYKYEIIKEHDIRFDEQLKAGAEDYAFNLEYLRKISRIGLTDYQIYKHFSRVNQSASVGYNENRQKGIIKDYHTETEILRKLDISSETYISHQLWYFYMLIREYCFEDTPLCEKDIINRLRIFLDEIEDFKTIHYKDRILLFKRKPKDMMKWEMMHMKKIRLLYKHFKMKYG